MKVIEATDRTVTIRILVSARDAGASWDLRCLVRERMLGLLRKHPDWLPTSRTETRARDSSPEKISLPPQPPPSEVKPS